MRRFRKVAGLAAYLFWQAYGGGQPVVISPPAKTDELAARVVILANENDPDSLRIARYYAEVRGVPRENLIALPLPLVEAITWREFVSTLWQPLLDELVRLHWIDAIPMALADTLGRRKYAPQSHRIAALVVCRGVPLKVGHDPALSAEAPPFTSRQELRTNAGAVDAELSLLARPNYPVNAFVPNPLFQKDRATAAELAQVIKVSRLDGPAVAHVLALIDGAAAVERTGLLGRAYVDLGDRDPLGDAWLESVALQVAQLGYELALDREPATFVRTARMDAPALYFGWYAGNLDGPFSLPGFQFPRGAIALHIHSYSAHTVRSAGDGWVGPLVARGVAATVGNVHEPYLQFTHRPDLLLRALMRGEALVDAAYYALPVLSWQAILVGDPLYRPFAVSLAEQAKGRTELPRDLTGYAVLRQMRELDTTGRSDEAIGIALAAQRDTPSLAVGVALAQRFRAANDNDAAAKALGFVPWLKSFPTDQWALARDAAELLVASGRPARACQVWRTILAAENIPADARLVWLRDAHQAAIAARDFARARTWEREIETLTPPPKKQ